MIFKFIQAMYEVTSKLLEPWVASSSLASSSRTGIAQLVEQWYCLLQQFPEFLPYWIKQENI